MSLDYKNDGDFHEKLIEEVLSAYPDKFAKRRRKHLTVAKPATTPAQRLKTEKRSPNAR